MCTAHISEKWRPNDGYNGQPKHVAVKRITVQWLVIKLIYKATVRGMYKIEFAVNVKTAILTEEIWLQLLHIA
jgi:hypothetical protein